MQGHIHCESCENSFAVRLLSDFDCYHRVNENCSVTSQYNEKSKSSCFSIRTDFYIIRCNLDTSQPADSLTLLL